MVLGGVLDSKDVSFVKATLRSMVTAATNPLTEAEKRRLLELIDKDELTLEEADELLQLARSSLWSTVIGGLMFGRCCGMRP